MLLHPVQRSKLTLPRAFVAASRRKDRSLDARLESAHRASLLHKSRTGKALHITKEIVEKEAMYEEIDECYQEKRVRMLHAQNMQIEEQFQRHLLATFNSNSRASMAAPAPPRNEGKMNLDLTGLPSPFSDDMQQHPLTSPGLATPYVLSPGLYEAGPQPPYMNGMSSTVGPASSQIPSYVQQMPTWPHAVPQQPVPWSAQGNMQNPNWPPHMAQFADANAPGMPMQSFRARERLGSAPEIPVQPARTTIRPPSHTRVRSEPNLAARQNENAQLAQQHSGANSPNGIDPGETQSTSACCASPPTPRSPTIEQGQMREEADSLMMSHEKLDPDFDDFSQFALALGDDSGMRELDGFGLDEFVSADEFAAMAPTF